LGEECKILEKLQLLLRKKNGQGGIGNEKTVLLVGILHTNSVLKDSVKISGGKNSKWGYFGMIPR